MTKVPVQPGIPPLTCVPAITVVSVCSQKKMTRSTLTANLFIWDANVREVTLEDSVIVTLTPVR